MGKVIIGIDLGGTNLRIGAVEENNNVLSFSKLRSSRIAHAADPMKELNAIIGEYNTRTYPICQFLQIYK